MFHKDLLSPLEMGTECEEKNRKVCYRAGDETRRLDLEEEWRKKCSSVVSPLAPCSEGLWVLRECLLGLDTGTKQWVVVRKFGWEHLCDPLGMGRRGSATSVLLQIWR